VVLAASDFSRAHKSDVLEDGQVLTHGLPTERQSVLHREPRNEREERLSVFLSQFVEQSATCGSGKGFEDVGHTL
jgi:hypothetical protein